MTEENKENVLKTEENSTDEENVLKTEENSTDEENVLKTEENSTDEQNVIKIEKPSLEDKLIESDDKLLRSLAEVENQRRRFEKEIKEAFEYGAFNFAKECLAILDNLQRAKTSIKNDESFKKNEDLDKFLKNIDILEKDMISIFERNKIKKINCDKQKFDPNIHQAMLEIEDENIEPGIIVQEIQPGYTYDERLLRPSFVGVSKKKSDFKEKKDEKKDP